MRPLSGFAAPGDPLLRLGVLGAYNETQFDSDDVDTDDKAYLGQGGLFLDFGNKLSGTQGLIYRLASAASTARRTISR